MDVPCRKRPEGIGILPQLPDQVPCHARERNALPRTYQTNEITASHDCSACPFRQCVQGDFQRLFLGAQPLQLLGRNQRFRIGNRQCQLMLVCGREHLIAAVERSEFLR